MFMIFLQKKMMILV